MTHHFELSVDDLAFVADRGQKLILIETRQASIPVDISFSPAALAVIRMGLAKMEKGTSKLIADVAETPMEGDEQ